MLSCESRSRSTRAVRRSGVCERAEEAEERVRDSPLLPEREGWLPLPEEDAVFGESMCGKGYSRLRQRVRYVYEYRHEAAQGRDSNARTDWLHP